MPHPKRRYHILLVDDEEGDVELTRLAFAGSPYAYDIHVARNGLEAMDSLRRSIAYGGPGAPDLVLLDLNMPVMNGKEVLREMKADPALAGIPVVILTTSDVERDVVASYDLGAAGFITKPVDLEELCSSIRNIEAYWFGTVRRPDRRG